MSIAGKTTRTSAGAEDRRDGIRVVGAREHNLKDVSLNIPKNRITVFVGVSGSGKSSIVFDTIAVEAQRQLNATFPWSIRNQLPKYERPLVDAIENLTTPVIVDQRPLTGNARSTVGTITDIYSMIRVLFARLGEPSSGLPSLYSFNDPNGMCPECEGLGQTLRVDPDLMLDRTKSLDEGAILLPGYPIGSPGWQFYANYQRLNPTKRLNEYTAQEMHALLNGMVDRGNTVVVIEHNLAVIEQADWIIDLGPEGGKNGGEIVFTGTPEILVAAKGSLTGEYLRRYHSRPDFPRSNQRSFP